MRFLVKHSWRDGYNGAAGESYQTVDIDVPELEAILSQGGFSENGYDMWELVGIAPPVAQQERSHG